MRILLLTMYYAPLNNIAVSRMINFKKYLEQLGNEVDVITRHYSEEELSKSNLLIADTEGSDIEEDYYNNDGVYYLKYTAKNKKRDFSNLLPKGVRGVYNIFNLDIFHYNFVERGLKCYEKEFASTKHDVIIASSPPVAPLILAKKLSLKYNTPWVADFRDSFFSSEESNLMRILKKRPFKKLLVNAAGLVFVSPGMRDQNFKNLPSLKNKPNDIIYNGYEPPFEELNHAVLDQVCIIKEQCELLLVYTGSVYPQSDLSFYLAALESINNSSMLLIIVGVQEEYKLEIEKSFSNLNLTFIPKVNYSTSIEIQRLADFLLLTIWKDNYTGFQGKIFEYLYSGVKIILDKQPPRDLKEYLTEYSNIYFAKEDVKELARILTEKKMLLKNSISLNNKLMRSFQVSCLHKFLQEQI